jgi:hypothetical protein
MNVSDLLLLGGKKRKKKKRKTNLHGAERVRIKTLVFEVLSSARI